VGLVNYLLISSVPRLAQTPETSGYGFGASIVVAGLILLPFSVASFLAGLVARPLDRLGGPRLALPVGALLLGIGTLLFGFFRESLWELFLAMAVAGLGVGTTFAALPGLITSAVPARETGSAMSVNQVLRYVGFAVGSALSATVLEAATPAGAALPGSGGYGAVALIGCGGCVLLGVLTATLPRGQATGTGSGSGSGLAARAARRSRRCARRRPRRSRRASSEV
jgi:MFS family permease